MQPRRVHAEPRRREREQGTGEQRDRRNAATAMLGADAQETTEKGSINQKAVLANRASLVEELYAERPGARVIEVTIS